MIAALVAATASLAVALYNARVARRRDAETGRHDERLKTLEHELRVREAAIEREADADEVLDRYRGPIVSAAFDLQERLDNLINPERGFLAAYRRSGDRGDEAVRSTLYRVAQWFGWNEILRREIQFLNFRQPERRRAVSDLFGEVARTFADDRYGQSFMIWFEEQRAIGERMIEREGDTLRCVGYATFVDRYDEVLAQWLGRFEGTLTHETASNSRRLADLRQTLRSIVERLDPDEDRYPRRWQRAGVREDIGGRNEPLDPVDDGT